MLGCLPVQLPSFRSAVVTLSQCIPTQPLVLEVHMRPPHLISIVLGSVLVFACVDNPTPTDPAGPSVPSFREGSGAQIIRSGFQFIFINDPDRDFSLVVGAPISEAPECGGPGQVT